MLYSGDDARIIKKTNKGDGMQYLLLFIKGMLVGAANVIPGVSGGTLAVVLGIFDTLIESVNHFGKNIKKSLKFLLPVGLGAAAGIILLGTLIDYCLRNYSFQTALFFVGLVAGSFPLIYKKATSQPFKPSKMYTVAAAAALVVIAMSLFRTSDPAATQDTFSVWYVTKLFLGGAVAAMAMVIPGISGSFVFVLLGLYPTVMQTISMIKDYLLSPLNFALIPPILSTAVPLGLGVLVGIVCITRLIAFLLKKYFSFTYFAILGLMLGTLFGIFNDPLTYQSGPLTMTVIVTAVLTFALGCVAALFLGRE